MIKIERKLEEQYVSNQARSIARLFALHSVYGAFSIRYSDIAMQTDLTERTVIKYVKELSSKDILNVYRHAPYENVYELNL